MGSKANRTLPTLAEFLQGSDTLAVYSDGGLVFRSSKRDLKPLVELLESDLDFQGDVVIFDRYVGRAAALLIMRIKPRKVFVGVISKGGVLGLQETGIEFEANEQVQHLMGVGSEGMCQWEKMAMGRSAGEFWDVLRRRRQSSESEETQDT